MQQNGFGYLISACTDIVYQCMCTDEVSPMCTDEVSPHHGPVFPP